VAAGGGSWRWNHYNEEHVHVVATLLSLPDLPVITDIFTATSASTAPTFTVPLTSTVGTWPSEGNQPPLDADSDSSLQLPSELLGAEFPLSPPQPTVLIANPPPDR